MPNVTTNAAISADLQHGARRALERLPRSRLQQQRAAGGDEAQGPVADLLAARAFARRCKSGSNRRSGTPATTSCSTRRSICSTTPSSTRRWSSCPSSFDAGNPQQRGRQPADGRLRQLHRGGRARARRPMDAALYGDGSANGGKQLTGLATAVPIVNNTGIYGGIDRAGNAIWQTTTYDATRRAVHVRSARRSTRPRSGRCSTTS